MLTSTTAPTTGCAVCDGDKTKLHGADCAVRAQIERVTAAATIRTPHDGAHACDCTTCCKADPCRAGAPPVTSKTPIAALTALGQRPFALWSYDLGRYLDTPTTWAADCGQAVRRWALGYDRGATFLDKHDRKAAARTRDVRVVWAADAARGLSSGLLRADEQPVPVAAVRDDDQGMSAELRERAAGNEPEPLPVVRPGLGFTDAEAARFAARADGYARQYLGGGGAFPASIPAIKARLASCALPPRDEWMGEIGAAIARLAPEYESDARAETLRSLVAFTVSTDERQIASCVVVIPARACDLRQGRAVVYQLAAWVERFVGELGPVIVHVNATMDTIGGLRGGVAIHVRPDVDVEAGVRCLHAAAAAVRSEIRAVV